MNKTPWQAYAIHNKELIHGFFGDYRWMSNFHYANVCFEGLNFPTNEHAFQFAKLPMIENKDDRYDQVFNLKPYETKTWIRSIGLRPDWENVKYYVMLSVNFAKYFQNDDLKKLLLETEDAHLEETNAWHDNIWGNCICPRCKDIEGTNYLGNILMKTRDYLKV